ncbi:MAG TPA: phosphoribosylformylglycinamidine synthase I [bacterium]|nr:phosphoribosylformylglycinamidine synthase I [bacterium]
MKGKIAIIQFPGVNCEYETQRALEKCGLAATIVRWNEPLSRLESSDGFVLPGGFSYEDRVRAGAIAAADDIVGVLFDEARSGKPVVGICNGAQVLVEAGLVPGMDLGALDLALAPNKGVGRDGYYANWVYVSVGAQPRKSAITCAFKPNQVVPIPIANSQGRFTSSKPGIIDELDRQGQVVLKYCRADGSPPDGFPDDPNGSSCLAAAIANPEGNVVAMMPHPERGTWLKQVPDELACEWSARKIAGRGNWRALEDFGPCAGVFHSLRVYIEERR